MREQPYFMKNADWYRVDDNDGQRGYKLTQLGARIPEVKASYDEYYAPDIDKDGVVCD